ncbi:MAG: DNA polymerase III subunit gamma/tau [Candidatus Liptonbacteria bacterium]|nr:DNA polymerase III subunit gamma/tau [Candidatus Liptonbacteria bacterium]
MNKGLLATRHSLLATCYLLLNNWCMALALYRKYRPKQLGEVLGQEGNINLLKNAAREGRLGHAYLFYGPRGTGKTTTARLIAKLLNCERRRTDTTFAQKGEPCNDCLACTAVDTQSSFDVIEIDAASNRGIDEIRNLKENIATAPAQGTHKIYIIDEAHMLTAPAWNALLKTLEEPPRHAVLILATTEYEKLPPTITSRTQRFLFKKLSKTHLMEKLRQIAKLEKIDIEDEALEIIAAAGEGSARDAESLLDQAASWGEKIDASMVEELTGRAGMKKVHGFAAHILKKELNEALVALRKLADEGHNMTEFTKELIHYLRKTLTLALNPNLRDAYKADFTDEELKNVSSLVPLIQTETCIALLRSLIRGYSEMRYSPFATIPLEIALIEQLSPKPGSGLK